MKTSLAARVVRPLLTLALLLVLANAASACPTCKEALAGNGEGAGDLVRGYFYSILFMMSMPFTILGAFSFSMYRAVQKSKADNTSDDEDRPV
jgi:hypothetical protein